MNIRPESTTLDERHQRYYTPPRSLAAYERRSTHGGASGRGPLGAARDVVSCDRSKPPISMGLSIDEALDNVVVVTGAHAGIGGSALTAMLAWVLHDRAFDCALIDADFDAGGLDVLLGLEGDPGIRFGQIDAPLGRIEGDALNHDLMRWEGVRVLPHTPGETGHPDWWVVQASIQALAGMNQVVLVDAGQGELLERLPQFCASMTVVVAELSVLGLARTSAYLQRLETWGCMSPLLVGMEPRGLPKTSRAVGIGEAGEYLNRNFVGRIVASPRLGGEIHDGLGIRSVPRCIRGVLETLADRIEGTMAFGRDG